MNKIQAIAMVGVGATLLYACTLDFGVYRGDGFGGGPTSSAGPTSGNGGDLSAVGPGTTTNTSTTTTTTGPGGAGGNAGGMGGNAGGMGGNAGGMGGMGGCPTTQPPDMQACTEPAQFCGYEANTVHCECWDGDYSCDACPATDPGDDTSCASFNFSRCFYGNKICFCSGGNWNCSECPLTEPANMDPCSGSQGAHCLYNQTQCSCFMGTWHCN